MSQTIKAQVVKSLALTMGSVINNLKQFRSLQGLRGRDFGVKGIGRTGGIPAPASQGLPNTQAPAQQQALPQQAPQAPALGQQQQNSPGVGGFAPAENAGQNISVGQPVTGLNIDNF